MTTNSIEITEEFKSTIKYFVDRSDSNRVDYILRELIEQSFVDSEFGHLIYQDSEQETNEYNSEMDCLVLDAVETEIKKQLLEKFDR